MKKKAAVKCRSEQPGPIVILGGAEHGPPLVEFMKARMKAEVRFMWLGLPKVFLTALLGWRPLLSKQFNLQKDFFRLHWHTGPMFMHRYTDFEESH